MVESSDSSSSSSEHEKSAQNIKKNRSSSGSDFETRPTSKGGISPEIASAVSKHSPTPKTNTTMNANVLAAMAKGTSKDFLTKMNAAMQRNLPPKLQLPTKKLKRIGFDNDQSSSSDNKQNPSKKTANTSSASSKSSDSSNLASEDTKKLQFNKNDSSSSDSDPGNESDAKRKTLLLKQQSMTKTPSEDSDSDSSNIEKMQPKVGKQVSFSESPTVYADKNPQVKVPNKSATESDSDSEDESKAKRIEEIKNELKKLQMSRKRRKSSSDDSESSSAENEKPNVPKVISSMKSVKTDQISSKSGSDESDDTKMTSIMTQRETPSKKSGVKGASLSESENSSDSDSSKNADPSANNSGSKHRSGRDSDAVDNCLIKRDKLFSQFLNENIEYREIKIKSSFDPALLNKDDDIYSCNIPKHIPPELLRNMEFSLDKLMTLNLGPEKYNIKTQLFKNKKQLFCLINRHKNTTLVKLNVSGHIKVFKNPEKVQINKQVNLAELSSEKKVPIPKLKERHPIFGADLEKVVLNETVQNRLDTMIEDLNKKITRSKKKKSKLNQEEDNVQVIKEDIYKMLNFLQDAGVQNESKIDGNKVEKSQKSKSKKISAKNIEIQVKKINDEVFAELLPKKSIFEDLENSSSKKSKKSKLKLNLAKDDGIESKSGDIELTVEVQKDAKNNKKSKKTKNIGLANSTFASPSISSNQKLFETNVSTIQSEPSKSLKHLEKIIKKVAKGKVRNDFITTNIESVNDTNNLEQNETVPKKKKKKSKDISKEI